MRSSKANLNLYTVCVFIIIVFNCKAQLPTGSIAKDFTFTDLKGVSHNLYKDLAAGKTVFIDFSATWCGPCWDYHNAHSFKDLYNQHGPKGTLSKDVEVYFIEGDAKTTNDDLYGKGTNTKGDWVTGEPYPIMDPTNPALANWIKEYAVKFYPTIYMICPNKRLTYLGWQVKTAAELYSYVSTCKAVGVGESVKIPGVVLHPNPAADLTTLSFHLDSESRVSFQVVNPLGEVVFHDDLGTMPGGAHKYLLSTALLPTGIYILNIKIDAGSFNRKLMVNR